MGGDFLAGFEWVAGLLVVALCLRVYGRLGLQLAKTGGRVDASHYIISDLLTAVLLGGFLGGLAFYGFTKEESGEPMTSSSLYESAILFGAFVAGIVGTFVARNVSITEAFGLRRISYGKALGWGTLLIIAAIPLVILSVQVMNYFLVERASTQKLIEFFSKAVTERNYPVLLATLLIPVIVAPISEEIIFRGYIYGTLKHYLGPLVAMFVVSLLFAAIHIHLSSILGLFVLAICFTLAYEMSGSLLVPIVMHILFNAFNLVQVFFASYWNS